MKLAVVPVADTSKWPFEPVEGTVGLSNTTVINGSMVALRGISGKLTQEQVDIMAHVYCARAGECDVIALKMALNHVGIEVDEGFGNGNRARNERPR